MLFVVAEVSVAKQSIVILVELGSAFDWSGSQKNRFFAAL